MVTFIWVLFALVAAIFIAGFCWSLYLLGRGPVEKIPVAPRTLKPWDKSEIHKRLTPASEFEITKEEAWAMGASREVRDWFCNQYLVADKIPPIDRYGLPEYWEGHKVQVVDQLRTPKPWDESEVHKHLNHAREFEITKEQAKEMARDPYVRSLIYRAPLNTENMWNYGLPEYWIGFKLRVGPHISPVEYLLGRRV